MTNKKIWFITGAGRGMGVDFVKAALAAGHAVVATGRDTDAVAKAVGKSDDLLVVKLDVTNRGDAEAAARAAVDRFGRITTIVTPGFSRPDAREAASVPYAKPSYETHAENRGHQLKGWQPQSGQQPGAPAKLARALTTTPREAPPPRRFIAGADAIGL